MPDLLAQGSDLVASGFDNAQIAKLPAPFANPLVRECLPDGVQESVRRSALYHVPKDAFLLHRRPGHLLSQWRGYSGGQGGFSIGFNTRSFAPLLSPTFRLIKVLYEVERQHELVGEFISGVVGRCLEAEAAGNNWGDVAGEAALGLAYWTFTDLALRFKNPGFCEEEEWRLMLVHSSWPPDLGKLEFHERANQLVPHMLLDLSGTDGEFQGRLPIRTLIRGPSEHGELALEALKSLLSKHKYHRGTSIRGSGIPLRA